MTKKSPSNSEEPEERYWVYYQFQISSLHNLEGLVQSMKSLETSQDTNRENDELDEDIFRIDSHSEADCTEITVAMIMIPEPNTVLHKVARNHN